MVKAGIAVPQVFPAGQIDLALIRRIAERAEALGIDDIWTSEQIVGTGLEPLSLLPYLAAITNKIRLGTSVIVLPHRDPLLLAKMISSQDQLSGGRMIVGVGLGGNRNDRVFGVGERRVRRFAESIEVMNSLWRNEATSFNGVFFDLESVTMEPKPMQKPRPPLWIGARVKPALQRAVRLGDGWMGQGSSSTTTFAENAGHIRRFLEEANRDPATFAISKRVMMAIDSDANRAIARMEEWFEYAGYDPKMARDVAIWGPEESVFQQLDEVVDSGAEHILFSPVFDYDEHLEAVANYLRTRS